MARFAIEESEEGHWDAHICEHTLRVYVLSIPPVPTADHGFRIGSGVRLAGFCGMTHSADAAGEGRPVDKLDGARLEDLRRGCAPRLGPRIGRWRRSVDHRESGDAVVMSAAAHAPPAVRTC